MCRPPACRPWPEMQPQDRDGGSPAGRGPRPPAARRPSSTAALRPLPRRRRDSSAEAESVTTQAGTGPPPPPCPARPRACIFLPWRADGETASHDGPGLVQACTRGRRGARQIEPPGAGGDTGGAAPAGTGRSARSAPGCSRSGWAGWASTAGTRRGSSRFWGWQSDRPRAPARPAARETRRLHPCRAAPGCSGLGL